MGLFGLGAVFTLFLAILGGLFYFNQDKVFQLAVERVLNSYQFGIFCIIFEDNSFHYYGSKKPSKKSLLRPSICDATIKLNNNKEFFKILATGGGSIGLGESYIDGIWDTSQKYTYVKDNTTPLGKTLYHIIYNQFALPTNYLSLRFYAQNAMNIMHFREWITRTFYTTKTKNEDLKDIKYHYDIGNDFFEGYLGPTLSGSCAIWNDETKTLEDAQNNKWNLIIKKIGIKKEHHVLDVGCGWGYFCNKIVEDTGAKCTGITLSKEQLQYAKKKFSSNLCKKELDKSEKGCVEFIFKDYRDAVDLYGPNQFDRVSSTGMIEHVHYIRINEYFSSLYKVVKKEGKMLIHGITMPDVYYEYRPTKRSTACQQSNFISKHIFPGGCIQHVDWWIDAALKEGFELLHTEHYGKHYSRTLKVWYDNLIYNWNNKPLLLKKQPNYDEKLLRKHEFYLAFCEAAFRTERVELTQLVFYKTKYNQRVSENYSSSFYWINNIRNPNQNTQ